MATSVIKRVNMGTSWKLQGTATDTNLVALPSEYEELLLVGRVDANNYWFSAIVPKAEVESTVRYPRTGFAYNASSNANCTFRINKSEAGIYLITHNNGTTLTGTFRLYYR